MRIYKTLAMVVSLLLVTIVTGCSTKPPVRSQQVELIISAAASMKDALIEIENNYQRDNPHVKLVFNFGGSGSLQKQIEQGAPVDIFISAAPKQLNELEKKDLVIKSTRRNLVENKLVIVVPKGAKTDILKYEDLTNTAVKQIALGETATVPAGQYAQQALQRLDIWDKVKTKAVFAKDVRTVLAYTETGNVDAGIVYSTDAAISGKVDIAAQAPAGTHDSILYSAAVLSGTKQRKDAEEFLNYLAGPKGIEIFTKYGFAIPK